MLDTNDRIERDALHSMGGTATVPLETRCVSAVISAMRKCRGSPSVEGVVETANALWNGRVSPTSVASELKRREDYVPPQYECCVEAYASKLGMSGSENFKYLAVTRCVVATAIENNALGGCNPLLFTSVAFLVGMFSRGDAITSESMKRVASAFRVRDAVLKNYLRILRDAWSTRFASGRLCTTNSFARDWIAKRFDVGKFCDAVSDAMRANRKRKISS